MPMIELSIIGEFHDELKRDLDKKVPQKEVASILMDRLFDEFVFIGAEDQNIERVATPSTWRGGKGKRYSMW